MHCQRVSYFILRLPIHSLFVLDSRLFLPHRVQVSVPFAIAPPPYLRFGVTRSLFTQIYLYLKLGRHRGAVDEKEEEEDDNREHGS